MRRDTRGGLPWEGDVTAGDRKGGGCQRAGLCSAGGH